MKRLLPLLGVVLLGCPVEPEPDPPPPIVDPISRPAEPTLSPGSFRPSEDCATCHAQHVDEWRLTSHAYAVHDPVFRALVELRQDEFGGGEDPFCMQCHTAIGTRGGEIEANFSFDDLSPVVQEGVTCEACHKISEVVRPWNAGHVLDEDGPMRGSIADPESSPFHVAQGSPLFESSELCGSCHDVIELDGLHLERPYAEWLESPAEEAGVTCQGCHMPEYQGFTTVDSTTERTLHRHTFVGVDVPLSDDFATPEEVEELRADVESLLLGSGTILVETEHAAGQVDVHVTVRNETDGHNLPTGSTFIRQMWVELVVQDATGATVYETGTLDANGDLRDAWSELDRYGDSDLIVFHSVLTDALGNPEALTWRATEHTSYALPPLYERTKTLFVPTAGVTYPLTVRGRLRFRTHAPWLMRLLELDELVDKLVVYDLDADVATVEAP